MDPAAESLQRDKMSFASLSTLSVSQRPALGHDVCSNRTVTCVGHPALKEQIESP